MITKLMDRLFSSVDDDFMNDLDRARDKGILNRVNMKFIRLPDETIKVYDRDNDESTIVKKSGSVFIAKSDDSEDSSLPNSIRYLGPIEMPRDVKASDFIELFSNKSVDLTKVFGIFGRPLGTPLTPDDRHRISNNLVTQREQLDDLNMAIKKKSDEEIKGTPEEVKHKELVNQRQELDRDRLNAKILGNEALLSNNPGKLKTATSQLFKEETKRADVDYKISQLKTKLDKESKQSKDNESGSGIGKYKGVASNRAVSTGRGRSFSSLQYHDSFYSHAGYENEHTLIIGKLSELKLAPNEHSKSKLLGDLSNLIDKINDESINNVTKSMLSELKKLKLNDPQYIEIIDDLIEALTSDSMTRMFTIDRDTDEGHYTEEQLQAMRDANLGKTINGNKIIGLAALGGATWGLNAMGALQPIGSMFQAVGNNIGKAFQWGNPIAMTKRYLAPNSAEGKQRQAEIAHENSLMDANGNPKNVAAERELNPISYHLKATLPWTPQHDNYRLLQSVQNLGGPVTKFVRGKSGNQVTQK